MLSSVRLVVLREKAVGGLPTGYPHTRTPGPVAPGPSASGHEVARQVRVTPRPDGSTSGRAQPLYSGRSLASSRPSTAPIPGPAKATASSAIYRPFIGHLSAIYRPFIGPDLKPLPWKSLPRRATPRPQDRTSIFNLVRLSSRVTSESPRHAVHVNKYTA
jgi:hypothetical protein